MKKPEIDYREFRFSRINEPQFRHLWLLLGWVGYFVLYFLTENFIPVERCTPIHCHLDDLIPFNEFFLIFYCAWYVLVFGSLLYYLLYDVKSFSNLQKFIMVTQAVAMLIYILFPSRQDMRPDEFVRDNVLTHLMAFIYDFDTATGVCPSLHVGYSLGILSVFAKKHGWRSGWTYAILFLVVMISISTAFVKQHSVIDIVAALPLGLLAEAVVFGKNCWIPRLSKQHA